MVKFAPNVVAMKMLINTNQLTDRTRERIIRNLNAGEILFLKYYYKLFSYITMRRGHLMLAKGTEFSKKKRLSRAVSIVTAQIICVLQALN